MDGIYSYLNLLFQELQMLGRIWQSKARSRVYLPQLRSSQDRRALDPSNPSKGRQANHALRRVPCKAKYVWHCGDLCFIASRNPKVFPSDILAIPNGRPSMTTYLKLIFRKSQTSPGSSLIQSSENLTRRLRSIGIFSDNFTNIPFGYKTNKFLKAA